MNKTNKFLTLLFSFSLIFFWQIANKAYAINLVNTLSIPGESIDLYPLDQQSGGANINRLGFFSDLYYDRQNNVYYGLSDRGPGGGVYDYKTRVQKFTLNINNNTGAIGNFQVLQTILFTNNGNNFNGQDPLFLNGNSSVLGFSFDPEGFTVGSNGHIYISDEYGPSIYEFQANGEFIRSLNIPNNLLPRNNGTLNYSGTQPVTTGRQINRGFEGLTISPDGSKLYGILQDPLVNEGTSQGRGSRNVRIVEFDVTSGNSTAQYIYQLESIVDINARVPSNTFPANRQGGNIGVSAIYALNNHEFLVLERDNRGLGTQTPTTSTIIPSGSKRVYKIDLNGASNIGETEIVGNDLPSNITPVSKTLYLDVLEALSNGGQIIPEKLEGLTIGPQLSSGDYTLLLGTDNDYSVSQNGTNVQFNVCTTTNFNTSTEVDINAPCPQGKSLIPAFLYSFRGVQNVQQQQIPESNNILGLILFGIVILLPKRGKF